MPKFGTYLAATWIMALGPMAHAGEPSVNDCGSSLAQVKQIIQSRFSDLNPSLVNEFVGRWIYAGKEPISISMNSPLDIMGYEILACPREDGRFTILWKNEKTKAGVLMKNGLNKIVISTVSYGTLRLDREGSKTASRD